MRALRNIAILLVVLLALAVAADRVAVSVVQKQAASRLDGQYGLTSRPKVEINGFPFLTQLISGNFDDVKLTESSPVKVAADGKQLTLTGLVLRAHGVTPTDDYQHARVDRAEGSAMLTYADFNKLMGDDRTTVKYGGGDRLRFTTTQNVLGSRQTITGTARVVVDKDGATIASSDVKLDGRRIPIVSDLVARQFSVSRRFTELPVGLRLQAVTPSAEGVRVQLSGTDLRL